MSPDAPLRQAIYHLVAADRAEPVAQGTAFAIGERHLLTCAHCPEATNNIFLLAETPLSSGKRAAKAKIRAIDEAADLALLETSFDLPSVLKFATSYPQRGAGVRAWRSDALIDDGGRLEEVSGLFGRAWDASASRVEMVSLTVSSVGGMSGGPVVDLNGEVIGVLARSFLIDGDQVAFNWRANVEPIFGEFTDDEIPPYDALVAEHLNIGIALAIAAPVVRAFLGSIEPSPSAAK